MTKTIIYGNTITIDLPPSVTKTTEQVSRELQYGPVENFVGSLDTLFVGYLFARTRVYRKELDVVKTISQEEICRSCQKN